MRYERQQFVDTEVELDGNEFDYCYFEKCVLVYSGGAPPSFRHCDFKQFRMAFKGCAGDTVAFLKVMARPSSGMQVVVRDTFPELFSQ